MREGTSCKKFPPSYIRLPFLKNFYSEQWKDFFRQYSRLIHLTPDMMSQRQTIIVLLFFAFFAKAEVFAHHGTEEGGAIIQLFFNPQ